MGDESVYNRWWKQPDKYKVFGVTIHEIEKAMDICNNKPFDQSEESFSRLEELLKVSLNVFKVTLLPGYDDNSKDKYDLFTGTQIYKPNGKGRSVSLCIVNDTRSEEVIPKHFLNIKDLSDFKHRIFHQSDVNNRNLARNVKYEFCDFFGSQTAVQNHEVQTHHELMDDRDQYELSSEETRLRFTNQQYEMPAPVVVYADFESAIDDKNIHKTIMLFCLAVSRIPTIDTQLWVFHTLQEQESDLRLFMEYLIQLQVSVKNYLFDESPLENTSEIERDYRSTTMCPFCHRKLEDDKVRHHAHVAGEYTTGKGEVLHFKAGEYICTCCTMYNLQLSFNKKNYRFPVYFHNGSHYIFTFIMKFIATMPDEALEVFPTTEDKEMRIEYNGIQFKDSLKLISSPLRSIVAQILGGHLDLYVHTKTQLRKYCESQGKQWSNEYIDLLTWKEPMFYTLIKSYVSLNNTIIPSRQQCIDDMKVR